MVFPNAQPWVQSPLGKTSFRLSKFAKWFAEPLNHQSEVPVNGSAALCEPIEALHIWQKSEATTLSGLDRWTETAWVKVVEDVSEYLSEEDVIASVATSDFTFRLMPESEYRVEIQIYSIEEWNPPVLGPEDM